MHFEQQSLLRIHQLGFARRDIEKRGVKFVDIVEEPALAGNDLARCFRISAVELVHIPSLGWNLRHRIAADCQHVPVLLQIRTSGKFASHADHGNQSLMTCDAWRRFARAYLNLSSACKAACQVHTIPCRGSGSPRRFRR